MTVTCGENRVVYRKLAPFSGDFRVFGVTMMTPENSPANHLTALLPALGLARSQEILRRTGCESGAVAESEVLQVLAATPAVRDQLASLKPGPARISGRRLAVVEHLFQGQPASLARFAPSSGSMEEGVGQVILVEEVR